MVTMYVLINLLGGLASAIFPGFAQAAGDRIRGVKIFFTLPGLLCLMVFVTILQPGLQLTQLYLLGFRRMVDLSVLLGGPTTVLVLVQSAVVTLAAGIWKPLAVTEFFVRLVGGRCRPSTSFKCLMHCN